MNKRLKFLLSFVMICSFVLINCSCVVVEPESKSHKKDRKDETETVEETETESPNNTPTPKPIATPKPTSTPRPTSTPTPTPEETEPEETEPEETESENTEPVEEEDTDIGSSADEYYNAGEVQTVDGHQVYVVENPAGISYGNMAFGVDCAFMPDSYLGYLYDLPDGWVYLIVRVLCYNGEDSDYYLSDWDFECYADNYVCDTEYIYTLEENSGYSTSCSVGSGRNGCIVFAFKVPEDAESYEIEFTPDMWSNDTAVIVVNHENTETVE